MCVKLVEELSKMRSDRNRGLCYNVRGARPAEIENRGKTLGCSFMEGLLLFLVLVLKVH